MCNLLWLSACFLAVCLPFALGDAAANVSQTEPQAELVPAAEKLIRYRRQPPYAVGKRSKLRRRTKGPPKIKYGPPPPPSQHFRYAKPSFPAHLEEPSFSLDDFQHLKFDGADFKIPTSSYEAQSMDLDFYNHDTEPDLYGAHKFPSLDFGLVTTHNDHVPHQKYGLPPVHQSFQPDHSFASHYEPPPPPAAAPAPAPAHPPATRYGVPTAPVPVPSFKHQDLPPPDSYSIYEQKIPNVKYHQNFAEPPKHGSKHNPNYEIAYSPPAFEISTSYQSNHQQSYAPPHPGGDGHKGSFAEPPSTNYVKPSPQHPPTNSYGSPQVPHHPPPPSYNQPAQHPSPSYEQPSQHPPANSYDPPHNNYAPPQHPPSSNYNQPPQHPPSSSYDQPPQHPSSSSYDQPPQHPPSSSYDLAPQHPPSTYDGSPQLPPLSSYDPSPQHPLTNYVTPDSQPYPIQSYPQDDYAPPSQELPLNPHHKFPSFDFPKSSYEVPIYDPIPFEASNREEQESYPPNLVEHNNEITSDAHAAGSSKRRKRKRKPNAAGGGPIVPGKHTLDVPELQHAYEADTHVGDSNEQVNTEADTAAHGSHYVERKQSFINFVTPTTSSTTTTPAPWSPMRGRSSTISTGFIPTIVTSTSAPRTTLRSRGGSRYRSTQPVSPSPLDPISSSVKIEQSHSQSYYDGTIAPPTRQQQQFTRGTRPTRPSYVRNQNQNQNQSQSQVSPLALQPAEHGRGAPTSKRTTKGVFDTTLFKSPLSDREMEHKLKGMRQNLPKNHKLY